MTQNTPPRTPPKPEPTPLPGPKPGDTVQIGQVIGQVIEPDEYLTSLQMRGVDGADQVLVASGRDTGRPVYTWFLRADVVVLP